MAEEVTWLKNKLADVEDRSGRNNIKIRGIPESVLQNDLRQYVQDVISDILPDLSYLDITIDRIHRLSKPAFLPEKVLRDVILRIYYFHVKERLLEAIRNPDNLPEKYSHLQFYPDLSQHTLNTRRSLLPITRALCQNHILYRYYY